MIDGMTSVTGSASGDQLAVAPVWYLVGLGLPLGDCPDRQQEVNDLERPDCETVSGIETLRAGLEMELSREIVCAKRPEEPQNFPCR